MFVLFFVSFFAPASTLEEYSYLGSCNDKSIPFKLEVNSRGRPELFCTRPICFGEHEKTRSTISCSRVFQKDICNEPNEWTGGLMEATNGTETSLKSKCCSFDSELEQIQVVKTVSLGSDKKFSGGLFLSRKGIEGFDMIKEIRRIVKNHRVEYEIMVIRMPCKVDVSEEYDLLKKLGYLEDKEENLVSDYYSDYEPVNYQQPLVNNQENYPQQALPQHFSEQAVTEVPPTLVSTIFTTLLPVKIVPRTIIDATTSTTTTVGTTSAETTVETTIKVSTTTKASTTVKYLKPKRLQFTQQKKKLAKKMRKSDRNDDSKQSTETTRLEELRV